MRLVRLVVVSVLVGAGLVASGAPAQAVVVEHSRAIVTIDSTGLPGYPATEPRFGDVGSFTMTGANYPGGVRLVFSAPDYEDTWGVQFAPPPGESFHRGHYPVVSKDSPTAGVAYGEIFVGDMNEGFLGDIDVLDWVPGPDDLPSRFDIVFRDGTSVASGQGYFGEIRLNQPDEGPVHLGSRHLEWPSTAVGSTPITATEWLHNTSGRGVSIGAPRLSGGDATDWRVTADTCPAELAAGATCSIVLGFSPTAGGPRISSLQVPIGGEIRTVSLTGQAPLGTSVLTYSGTDYVSGGQTHTFANGPYVMTAGVDPGGVFTWTESTPYESWYDPRVRMSAPGGGPLAVGTHATVGTIETSGVQYGQSTSGLGAGCGSYTGSMTVHAFTVDATGAPAMANIDYTQRCREETDPSKVMTAHLLWQYRSDTTPPEPPTGIVVSGASVRWTRSVSGDAVESIARLVPGTGQDATPTTGYPLSSGSATTAPLPALTSGETYTIEVFAVDATGNVSSPQTKTLLG